MKLNAKTNISLAAVFGLLALMTGVAAFRWQSDHAVKAAENRVGLYIKSAWEIYNAKIERILAALKVLAEAPYLRTILIAGASDKDSRDARVELETLRKDQGMDILILTDRHGRVLLRAREPGVGRDDLSSDPLIAHVLANAKPSSGTVLLSSARLKSEGAGLREICERSGGEARGMMAAAAVPIFDGRRRLLGVIEMGNLLNGAQDKVDRIRDSVFENEQYHGRPVGTATIFMGDLRVSTNVIDQGRSAIGTRASAEVTERVLKQARPWTGRAWVVNDWYLSRYDPIRDPDGRVIGMLYIGALEQQYLDLRSAAVRLQLILVLGAMLLAMGVLYIVIRRTILDPVQRLHLATTRLSAGELSHRVEVASRDEIGDLARSFNSMAARLLTDQAEIQASHAELAQRNADLATINRHYMEMLGFVTHELKAPLGSAILGLYTVRDGYLGEVSEQQKRVLTNTGQSLDYMSGMIRRYLDLSRLEKGELRVVKRWIALRAEVVDPLIEGLAAAVERKAMAIENDLAPGLRAFADRDQLMIVFDNLLSNAVKYGREHGRVRLFAVLVPGAIRLSVENDGEGIPREQIGRLFKKFARLEGQEETPYKGTGLGLFISKAIIEQHGGEIFVESEEGRWARFSFTLPLESVEEK
jgi:two-component system NtrC family sensor kinase